MNKVLTHAITSWQELAPFLMQPDNEAEYNEKVAYLDELLTIVGNDENHELMPLIDLLSDAIAQYDAEHYSRSQVGTGVGALKFLMHAQGLKQKDLDFLGSQGVVSEILNGKRKLNMRHVKVLAEHFNLSIDTFID